MASVPGPDAEAAATVTCRELWTPGVPRSMSQAASESATVAVTAKPFSLVREIEPVSPKSRSVPALRVATTV